MQRRRLVLSRKVDEDVVINMGGEEVNVKIVENRQGKVKILFTAAQAVIIHRGEVAKRIAAELAPQGEPVSAPC